MEPAIRVDNLVKVYHRRGAPDVRAVDGLSFDVAPGAIFGLLGPNGAGKSTTLRILTTLTRPTGGRASILGHDVVTSSLDVRRRIVVVLQEQAAEMFLSVRDNLLTFARFHGFTGPRIKARADEVLAQLELSADASRKVMDLSGGSRRRVQVAKVFMVNTPVAFLDEFSTGMDPILKRSVMALLRQEADRGRTIVLTTHVLSEAEALCDDILIMDRGRQVARGDLHALKLLSRGVYRVALTFDGLPEGIEAELVARHPLQLRVTQNTVEMALKEDESQVLELVSGLVRRVPVLRVEIGSATLEDIFIELMEQRPGS